ncbi:MAG: hypothetical protein ABIJ45_02720 [Candidatus Zixiibacteriota bacterium]
MIRILPYILYLFIIAFYRTILIEPFSIFGAVIDLSALLVVLVGFYKSESIALWFGLAAAVIIGSQRLEIMPWEMVVLGAGAVVINQFSFRVNLESLVSRLLILGAFVLVHQVVASLLVSPNIFFYSLYKAILPSVIYTVALGWVFFQFKDGKVTIQNIKSLF